MLHGRAFFLQRTENREQRTELRRQKSDVRGQGTKEKRQENLSSVLCHLSSAFTLVEILIALAILAAIVASTFTIFRSSSKSWQKGETRSERYHSARTAIGKMSAEISQAVMGENNQGRFIGEKDEVRFISFISTASGIFELAEIEYWLDNDERFLMRNEDTDPDYDFSTQDHSDILSDNITLLEFSYFDGLTWSDTWDSVDRGQKILPEAVKIRIQVEDRKGKESETFEVITRLKTA